MVFLTSSGHFFITLKLSPVGDGAVLVDAIAIINVSEFVFFICSRSLFLSISNVKVPKFVYFVCSRSLCLSLSNVNVSVFVYFICSLL